MRRAQAILVIGLAYGDCGKGGIVDFLARRYSADLVVRFNGGPQAGHNVVTPDGRHHTFSQFGSATFLPSPRTLLSRFVLIDPYAIFNEARHLEELGVGDALPRLMIDGRCPVITPCHQAANRIRELFRGDTAHGTCGMGIGELMQDICDAAPDILRASELADRFMTRRKLLATRDRKISQIADAIAAVRKMERAGNAIETLHRTDWIDAAVDNYAALARSAAIVDEQDAASLLAGDGTMIFEGAQGVLLDETFGFQPHTTWSKTTFANADTLLDEAKHAGSRTRIGVLRTYFTRHGSGPFITEDATLRPALPEPHNSDDGWQGAFRVGYFDAVAARYALRTAGNVDGLAITFLDRLAATHGRMAVAYENCGREEVDLPANFLNSRPVRAAATGDDPGRFLDAVRRQLGCSIRIASYGASATDKYFI